MFVLHLDHVVLNRKLRLLKRSPEAVILIEKQSNWKPFWCLSTFLRSYYGGGASLISQEGGALGMESRFGEGWLLWVLWRHDGAISLHPPNPGSL